jgi:hypothetical protein
LPETCDSCERGRAGRQPGGPVVRITE